MRPLLTAAWLLLMAGLLGVALWHGRPVPPPLPAAPPGWHAPYACEDAPLIPVDPNTCRANVR